MVKMNELRCTELSSGGTDEAGQGKKIVTFVVVVVFAIVVNF